MVLPEFELPLVKQATPFPANIEGGTQLLQLCVREQSCVFAYVLLSMLRRLSVPRFGSYRVTHCPDVTTKPKAVRALQSPVSSPSSPQINSRYGHILLDSHFPGLPPNDTNQDIGL